MSEHQIDHTLKALEAKLSALQPRSGGLDRDRLLFQAGRATGLRGRWIWPIVAAALGLLAAGEAVLLLQPGPQSVRERLVSIREVPVPASESSPPSLESTLPISHHESPRPAAAYLRIREQVVRWGLAALPGGMRQTSAAPPAEPSDLMHWRKTLTEKETEW